MLNGTKTNIERLEIGYLEAFKKGNLGLYPKFSAYYKQEKSLKNLRQYFQALFYQYVP